MLDGVTGFRYYNGRDLCTIEDAEGEHDILRDNMPFATPGKGEYGTYFIGCSRHLWVTSSTSRTEPRE